MSQDGESEQHTLIHAICEACGEPDVLTIVEHARDSAQTQAVADAHHTIAEEHADETGHHVQVGESEDDPEAVRELARSKAPSVSGATPEDFGAEVVTDGGQPVGEHPGPIDVARQITFATEHEHPIRAHEKTATVRIDGCEGVHRGDVVELATEDGSHIDTVRITRVSECRVDEALKHIDLWNARYPIDTIGHLIGALNHHYERTVGLDTDVRVLCWDPTGGDQP